MHNNYFGYHIHTVWSHCSFARGACIGDLGNCRQTWEPRLFYTLVNI